MSTVLEDLPLMESHRTAPSFVDEVIIDQRKAVRSARLTMRELRAVLAFEINFVCVCAENLAAGLALGDQDRLRLLEAQRCVSFIFEDQLR